VWNTLLAVYEGLYSSLPPSAFSSTAVDYFGNILLLGSEGIEVRYLQEYLNVVAKKFEGLPSVVVSGFFDSQTENAVREFQKMFGIKETGVVSSTTWLALAQIYNAVKAGE
jgi:peptidoglycan hydrolase-like protein with peptidoglycan-binding domain